MAAEKKPVLGLLTGISYVSGVDYYRGISERFGVLLGGKGKLMPRNPLLSLVSVDCDEYAYALTQERWDDVYAHLLSGVDMLVASGIDVLVIVSNTGHMCLPVVAAKHPSLRVLHIADCTARAITARGFTKVGLLGTEPTMRRRYLKDRLALHGVETLVPERDEDLRQIFTYIMKELGQNVFADSTRAFFADQVAKLVSAGCQGVILGCTEIELLELADVCPGVPLFRSAELHIEACARVAAGLDDVAAYDPAAGKAAAEVLVAAE